MKIQRVIGREIFDSRGMPTVQCQIYFDNNYYVQASVPAGTSKSSFEAQELRDNTNRFFGMGVLKAIENIEQVIAPNILGKEPDAIAMDNLLIELDGTPNKSRLGSNAVLAVSMALYRAEAYLHNMELFELIAHLMGIDYVRLPFPFFNLINGGRHGTNRNLQIQEFMVLPVGAQTFRSSMEVGISIFYELKNLLEMHNRPISIGIEGGFTGGFLSDEEALELLLTAIERINEKIGTNCVIALDVAASTFYNKTTKLYQYKNNFLETDQLIEYYLELIKKYPIYSIEDGLSENDWDGWKKMNKILSNKVQVVADDVFATNIEKIAQGIYDDIAVSVIIKPNQIGTITETLQAIMLCKEYNLNMIVSHRSGETDDTFIADLAVGANIAQIKAGSPCRERISKYNRLLCIEDDLLFGMLKS